MSSYTTELRYICETESGLDFSVGYSSVQHVIERAREKIFDFAYPIFDEAYRSVLETKILKHYYTREIGEETYGLWKLRLDTKLNEIMPYYNKLYSSELIEFNPIYSKDITREGKKKVDSDKVGNEKIDDVTNGFVDGTSASRGTNDTNSVVNYNGNSGSIDKYSDTPQGTVERLADDTYLTNARIVNKNENSLTNTITNSADEKSGETTQQSSINYGRNKDNTDKMNSTEDYVERVHGFDGSASILLKQFRETFLNIDMMVIDELSDLFFGLW